MNYLMCSVGRRCELINDFKKSIEKGSKIIATDNSKYAPALYFADKFYLAPRIEDPQYIDFLLDICIREKIDAVFTLIDPEIMVLAKNRNRFKQIGVEVLTPSEETAKVCFDKYEMFKSLQVKGVKTVKTWASFCDTKAAINNKETSFPLFVKPRTGSGSVGAKRVYDLETLERCFQEDNSIIAQELMDGIDLDADVYVDIITHEAVAVFLKKKISTTIGGANKTISFKDERLFGIVKDCVEKFDFAGPIDMDFFFQNGEYYLSEINPRFGGAYLHAYGAGVDFIKLIENNLNGIINNSIIGEYEEGIVMMMYDSVVIKSI